MNEKLQKKVSPPFEEGEIYQTFIQYFTFCFVLNSLRFYYIQLLKSMAKP